MIRLLDFFIKRSFIVNLTSVFICIVGLIAYSSMKRDLIPSFKIQLIHINATLPGASSIEMEKHVTFPIEETIKSIPGIEKITSTSSPSHTSIKLHFESAHENIEESVELVKSSIESIQHLLPQDLRPIRTARFAIDSVDAFNISIQGADVLNENDLNWIDSFKESLLKIHGIVKVETNIEQRHIFIEFDKDKIIQHGIIISDVRQKIDSTLAMTPIGSLDHIDETISIVLKKGNETVEQLKMLPIIGNRSGNTLYLKDIASIKYRPKEKKHDNLLDGKPHVSFTIHKNLNSDVVDLKTKIVERIDIFQKKFPSHMKIELTGDAAKFIKKQISVLQKNGLTGFLLVLVILYIFLGTRVSIVTGLGIPFSYLGTFIVLQWLGVSIDLISIVGMILVIGILVDDAIIVSEHYAMNLQEGLPPQEAAFNAAKSTIIPVTGTIVTTIVAFAPMILIKSEASEILFAIPAVVITSLIFSWFESFFILPNHLQHLIRTPSKKTVSSFYKKMTQHYRKILTICLKNRYWLLGFISIFMIFSIYWASSHMPKNFSLTIGEERITITAILKKSLSIEETRKTLQPIHDFLNTLDRNEIKHVHSSIGSIYRNHRSYDGIRYATISVIIASEVKYPKATRQKLTKIIEKKLTQLKTDSFEELYAKTIMKGDEKNTNDIVTIFVSGGDKISFEKLQKEIETNIKKVNDVTSIFIDEEAMQESWQFNINEKALIRYKIAPEQVALQIRELIAPQELSQVRFNGENTIVYTQFIQNKKLSFEDLQQFKIVGYNDIAIPLSFLGAWEQVKILKKITHQALQRKFEIDVRYDKDKTNKDKIAKALEKALKPLTDKYPAYNFSINKANEQEEKNKAWMLKIALVCIGSILFVLALCLSSIIQPFLVAFAIPFGIIGIIWALHFHGLELGVMAIIGLIGMAGVVVNDSLIMVDFINKIKSNTSRRDKIIEGATKRLRPIIITTATTLGGVFPMAYGIGGESGFTQPLAFSMGWGLSFATILTLFVIPALLEITNDCYSLIRKVPNFYDRTKARIRKKVNQ